MAYIHFIRSIRRIHSPEAVSLILWDLGLTSEEVAEIEHLSNNKMRHLNYSAYPDYFNININAGEYAWKPALIYETVKDCSDTVAL